MKQDLDQSFQAWKTKPNPQNTSMLLNAAEPVISSAIKSYAGGDRALSGRAKSLALNAFNTYDPKKGNKLNTHLMSQLQPLRRDYHNRMNPLKVPERAALEWRALAESEEGLASELGRPPSDIELADRSNLSQKKIRRLRQFKSVGIPASYFDEEADDDTADRSPMVSRPDPQKMWMEFVHHDLPPVDQKILEWKTGAFGHPMLSNNDIARKLRLSPGAVSQRSARIANRLAEVQDVGDIL